MRYNFDPELAPIVEMLPDTPFDDPVAARNGMNAMIAAMLEDVDESGVDTEDRHIPGPAEAPAVPVRIYFPRGRRPRDGAALLYIHGGGFVVGDLNSEHGGAVALCRDLGIAIVSVDYRLAPEHPYPAGLEDCYAALAWMHEEADALGLDVERIGIMGGSAGGGLAASLALLAKQRGGPAICFQFLGIPELDDRLRTVSMREFVDTPLWHRPNAVLSWRHYLGDAYRAGSPEVPLTAAPGRADIEDLRGLPAACVTTMEFDPLRDEGLEYAQKLLQAGVSVELHSYPGTFHGSSLVADAAVSRREAADTRAALRRGLELRDRPAEPRAVAPGSDRSPG